MKVELSNFTDTITEHDLRQTKSDMGGVPMRTVAGSTDCDRTPDTFIKFLNTMSHMWRVQCNYIFIFVAEIR